MKDLCKKMEGKTIFFEALAGCWEPALLSVWKLLT